MQKKEVLDFLKAILLDQAIDHGQWTVKRHNPYRSLFLTKKYIDLKRKSWIDKDLARQ